MWTCFLNFGVYPWLQWNISEKLCFEPSQIATVTNCDNSGIPAVAICDLSQFVIKAVTAQTESNITENVFWVLGRVSRFTLDMNMKSRNFTHYWYKSEKLCFEPSQIATVPNCDNSGIRYSKETFLKLSDVYVNVFSALRNIPSGTINIKLRSCVLNHHKLRQSQIATSQEFLPSQFVICRNLWPRLCRGKFSKITLKMCSVYLGE